MGTFIRTLSVARKSLLAFLFALIGASLATAAETPKSEGSLSLKMPKGAVAFVELNGLGKALQDLRKSEYVETILKSPQWKAAEKNPEVRRALAAVQLAEMQLGVDAWTAADNLLGGTVAVGVYPKEKSKQPDAVLMLRAADASVLPKLQERIETFIQVFAPKSLEGAEEFDGAKVVSINDKAFYLIQGRWLIVSSRRELLLHAAKLAADKGGATLPDDDRFRAAYNRTPGRHLAFGYLDMKTVREIVKTEKLKKPDNVLASLWLGGLLEMSLHGNSLGIAVDATDERLTLRATVDGSAAKLGDAYRGFFSDAAGPGVPPLPNPQGMIAVLSFHRDLAALYRGREALVRESILPGFDKFESGLSNLLPGKSFGDDVLTMLGKSVTFVVAPQSYTHLNGKPGVKLPGFAMIADLSRAQDGADIFQLFFQTLVTVLNFQVNESGGVPMVIRAEQHEGVIISFGMRLQKPKGDHLPIGANFTPAAALVGDRFIMSSSLDLCRTLVDQLKNPTANSDASKENRNFILGIHFDTLADILESNREVIVARMVSGGKTPERAGDEFSLGMKLLRMFDSASLSESVKTDTLELRLEVRWR